MTEQKELVSLRRLFRNEKGDWKETERLIKEITTYAKVVEDLASDLVKADKKLSELTLEAYKIAPKTDCLFYDSPLSPAKQTFHLKLFLKKLGWNGVRDVFMNDLEIQPFTKQMKDACRWLVKFKENEKA